MGPREAAPFWVEYRGRRFEVGTEGLTLGRAAECHVVLDDALVSRRHARLNWQDERLVVEDLGSANGVFVNERKVRGQGSVCLGDRITIGRQRLTLSGPNERDAPRQGRRELADTLHSDEELLEAAVLEQRDATAARSGDSLEVLSPVVEKMLALGRGAEAERMISLPFNKLLAAARAGVLKPDAKRDERLAALATRLAAVTEQGRWLDYLFEVFTYLGQPPPSGVVDELYHVLRRVESLSLPTLREYIATLRAAQDSFGPAEKFLVQRVAGLERLAALK